jgi:scyllo-inositol 2-dehydrogenase (NADP+)
LGTEGAIVMSSWDKIDVTVEHKGHLASYTVNPKKGEHVKFYQNIAGHLMRNEELIVKPEEARRTIGIIETAEISSSEKHTVVPKYQ